MAKRMHPTRRRLRTAAPLVVTAAAVVLAGGVWAGVAGATNTPSITTVAGDGVGGYSGDGGPAVKAELNIPTGVAENVLTGTLYIGDTQDQRVRMVVTPTTINKDVITTIAGTGVGGFSGDGNPATTAQLDNPSGVAVDSQGDVFIADSGNNRIRKINTSGIISTYAGTGSCRGSLGNGGPASSGSLCVPTGIALDHSGDLFIADTGHNIVREVTTGGVISTFAGTGSIGSSGDGGPATKATLAGPTGVATDAVGDVYISDTGNSKIRIVNSSGTISTFAGTGSIGSSGDGGLATKAQLSLPTGVGLDPSGDVFVSDTGNSRIREVNTGGVISTYAGTGTPGFSGDGGAATAAQIKIPTGDVAADGSAVYFSDTGNQRVRGIFIGPPPVLPQSGVAILLPLTGGLVVAGGALLIVLRRRRHPAAPMTA
jgi:sugar lactone lactonase YvrE